MLIKAGSNPNTTESQHNQTLLWVASHYGHTEIAEALRAAGAKE
jgi:hypothetical protein